MATFTIPTIYTAVDKFSAPVKAMEKANASFGSRLEATTAKSERLFRKLTPGLNDASKQFLQMASAAAIAGAAIAGGAFSVKAIMDYETAIQSLQAVTGVSNSELVGFKTEIADLATKSKKSSIDVAKSFEVIGSAMSEYLSDPKGLRQIAEAGITLSKASRMELEPTLQALTSVMNQFGLKAGDAADTINRLTAGEIVGSVSTAKISEYLQEFGASAKGANIRVGESVALIEALGIQMSHDKIAVGARNILTVLDSAKGLDKNALKSLKTAGVDTGVLMDKSKSLGDRLTELSKIQNDAVAIVNVFGKENKTAGQVIFNQLDKYKEFALAIEKTNKAEEQAGINSNTLANRLEELKNRWINMLTSSDKANVGLEKIKKLIVLVADNLDTIVSVGINVIKFYALWKAANIVLNGAMLINNIRLGINNALKLQSIALLEGNAVATAASAAAADVMAASIAISSGNMAAFNAVLLANPIGAVVLALAALGLAIYGVSKAVDAFDEPYKAAFEREQSLKSEGLSVLSLRDKYLLLGKTLKEAERMAVGQAAVNLNADIISAKMQLASPLEEERDKGVAAMNTIQGRAQQLSNFNNKGSKHFGSDFGNTFGGQSEVRSFNPTLQGAEKAPQYDWIKKELINPKEAQANATATAMTNKVEANFTINAPQGTTVTGGDNNVKTTLVPQTSSTMQSAH